MKRTAETLTSSVSASQVKKTIAYINNQKQHHQKRSFEDEFIQILDKHQVEGDLRNVFRWFSAVRFTDFRCFSPHNPALKCWATIIRPLRGLLRAD